MAYNVEVGQSAVIYQNTEYESVSFAPMATGYERAELNQSHEVTQVRKPVHSPTRQQNPRSAVVNPNVPLKQNPPPLPPKKTYKDASTSPMNIKKSKGKRWIYLFLLLTICLIFVATISGLLAYQMASKKSNIKVAEQHSLTEIQSIIISNLTGQWSSLQKGFLYRLPGSTCLGNDKEISFGNSNPFNDKLTIYPPGLGGVDVYCDTSDGGGWIVVQYRSEEEGGNFTRSWEEYVAGFGNSGGYWIGLHILHKLTNDADFEMKIDLEDGCGHKSYAIYSDFRITGMSENYSLKISGFSGTAPDSLSSSAGKPFTIHGGNHSGCQSRIRSGGWWYDDQHGCMSTNLNGRLYSRNYLHHHRLCPTCSVCKIHAEKKDGVYWKGFGAPSNLTKSTKMKIRLKPTILD